MEGCEASGEGVPAPAERRAAFGTQGLCGGFAGKVRGYRARAKSAEPQQPERYVDLCHG